MVRRILLAGLLAIWLPFLAVGGEMGMAMPFLSCTRSDGGATMPSPSCTQLDVATAMPSHSGTQSDAALAMPSPSCTQPDAALAMPSPSCTQPDVATAMPSHSGTQLDVATAMPSHSDTQLDVATAMPSHSCTRSDIATAMPSHSCTQPDVAMAMPSSSYSQPDSVATKLSQSCARRGAGSSSAFHGYTRPDSAAVVRAREALLERPMRGGGVYNMYPWRGIGGESSRQGGDRGLKMYPWRGMGGESPRQVKEEMFPRQVNEETLPRQGEESSFSGHDSRESARGTNPRRGTSQRNADDHRGLSRANARGAEREDAALQLPEPPLGVAAPRGYKPVYISHFGRHGARYDNGGYARMHAWLEGAHEAGALTPFGESVRERYARMYPHVRQREGDLSFKGREQQAGIAQRMYRRYRPVFRRAPRIEAVSSTVPRCIVTMEAFCRQMVREDPSLVVRTDVGDVYMAYMNVHSEFNPHNAQAGAVRREGPAAEACKADYRHLTGNLDLDPFVHRLFRDTAYADSLCGGNRHRLARAFYYLAAAAQTIDYEENFHDIFTPEEWYRLWEHDNFQFYAHFGPSRYFGGLQWACADTLLSDMLTRAEEDLADGEVGLRARFGHDVGLMSLLALLGAEGFTDTAERPEDVAALWQSWRFPMSVNLQWVFYRNRAGDMRVRVLLNEEDLKLPLDGGPYYEWTAFRSWCRQRLALAHDLLNSARPAPGSGPQPVNHE